MEQEDQGDAVDQPGQADQGDAVDHGDQADLSYEVELVDGELVEDFGWTRAEAVDRALAWTAVPAVQTAVAAATGFVAGAATLALIRRYGVARVERAAGAGMMRSGPGRTYIVHVRTLRPNPPIGPGSQGE